MHRTDKYWEHSWIIWSICQSDWVFVYELNVSGFGSSCGHLNFRFGAWFEEGVPWHSGNYWVLIHSETRTSHNKNIQSNAVYRKVLRLQLNDMVIFAKWLSIHLPSKGFRVWVQLQSVKLQISHMFWVRRSLTFRQL